ncbi:MAG: zinc ribbon domain-containing protein [Bdellovibrionales bacterium]|nr:zinc ribbon domain-containing protein [Bdellovibrionales bacterium]
MPLYEYQCVSCEKIIEIIQKFSDEPLKTCPKCGKTVKKLMSLGSFQLKGTGWYASDYKKAPPSTNSQNTAEKTVSSSSETCSPTTEKINAITTPAAELSKPTTSTIGKTTCSIN